MLLILCVESGVFFVLLIVLQAMWSSEYKSSNSGRGILGLTSSSVVLIEFSGKFTCIHRH